MSLGSSHKSCVGRLVRRPAVITGGVRVTNNTAFVLGHIQKPKAAAAASAPSTLHSPLHIALQPPRAPRVCGPYLSPINYIYKLLHSGAWGPPPRFSFIQTCQIKLVKFLCA